MAETLKTRNPASAHRIVCPDCGDWLARYAVNPYDESEGFDYAHRDERAARLCREAR